MNAEHEGRIQLLEVADKRIFVLVRTRNGTATSGEDYINIDQLVTIEPASASMSVPATIIGDDLVVDDETLFLELSDPVNARLEGIAAGITIINDDIAKPYIFSIHEQGANSPLVYQNMTLVWQDEFDDPALNLNDWSYKIGPGSNGWGKNELQFYREQNTSIVDGHLVIEARKEFCGGSKYTSSRIITMDKQSFEYGRIDIRAALLEGQGMWPALWMLGFNFKTVGWPACGEIDIMELVGGDDRENTVLGTVHWLDGGNASYGGEYTLESGIFNDKFHVFSIIWDETTNKWLVDDEQYHVIDITAGGLSEFHQEFFFIFNIAVGGTLPGDPDETTVFPQRMIVDCVRVFQYFIPILSRRTD